MIQDAVNIGQYSTIGRGILGGLSEDDSYEVGNWNKITWMGLYYNILITRMPSLYNKKVETGSISQCPFAGMRTLKGIGLRK